jgi:hypothetical protein
VADLARTLIESGYMHDLSDGTVKNLISAVKNSAGRIVKDPTTGIESVVGGEKNYESSVRRVFDIMIDSQLKSQKESFDKMLSVKATKVNAKGVEVQGKLDIDGQRIVSTLRKAMEFDDKRIQDLMEEAMDAMSSPREVEANQAQLNYTALNFAKMYKDAVKSLEDDLTQFDIDLAQAKEDYQNGKMSREDYEEFCDETKNLAQKSKIELAEEYARINFELSNVLNGSIDRAKSFLQAQKDRINEVQHYANSIYVGRPATGRRLSGAREREVVAFI